MPKIPIFAIVAAVLACAPAVARANPLLSGYGGPGQGNQAILGATLIGGSGGSGGSGTSGGPGGPGGNEVSAISTAAPTDTPSHGSTSSTSSGRGSKAPRGGAGAASASSAGGAAARSFRGYTATERVGVSQPVLGLSGQDLLYLFLVLAVLAFTGVITGRLARPRTSSELSSSRGAA